MFYLSSERSELHRYCVRTEEIEVEFLHIFQRNFYKATWKNSKIPNKLLRWINMVEKVAFLRKILTCKSHTSFSFYNKKCFKTSNIHTYVKQTAPIWTFSDMLRHFLPQVYPTHFYENNLSYDISRMSRNKKMNKILC